MGLGVCLLLWLVQFLELGLVADRLPAFGSGFGSVLAVVVRGCPASCTPGPPPPFPPPPALPHTQPLPPSPTARSLSAQSTASKPHATAALPPPPVTVRVQIFNYGFVMTIPSWINEKVRLVALLPPCRLLWPPSPLPPMCIGCRVAPRTLLRCPRRLGVRAP